MAIFGTLGIFTRMIPLQSGEIALYRAILASFVLILVLSLRKGQRKIAIKGKTLLYLFLSGSAMGFNWIFLFEAYNYTSITAATLSYYFAPTIVLLLSPVLLKETMTKRKVFSFIISTVGLVMVIINGNLGGGKNDLFGVSMGLIAAALYATVILINKKTEGCEGIERTLLQFIAAIIVLTPYVALTGGFNLFSLPSSGWFALLTLGIFHTGITYAMYFSSLIHLKGSEISILSYIDPLTAMVVSIFIRSEPTTVLQIIGGVLILGGTLFSQEKG